MKLILFNGPPRAGKDTASRIFRELLGDSHTSGHEKFSRPLKGAFAGMMNVHMNEDFVVDHYEDHKDEIVPELDVSFRRWQQDYSEKFMKPLYGKDVFARLLIGRIDRIPWFSRPDFIVVSDCGFQNEVDYVLDQKMFWQIYVVRIMRNGTSFEGDTREWVRHPSRRYDINIYNNGDLLTLKESLKDLHFAAREL
jgi:hypothetical protein